MARKPIFEFKVYTDGPVDSGPNERDYDEGVWEDDNWKKRGPQLGTVHVKEKPKPSSAEQKKKDFVAKFTFNDGTKITVKGDLPAPDGLTWIGSGPADAKDDNSHATKPLTVEGRNPKRWG